MRRLATAVVVALALVAPATAHAAKPAKVTGKLTGAKLPAAGKGRVVVWALRLANGVVVDSTSAKRGGFTLETAKGSHAILATVVPERGRKDPVHRVADFVTAKPGKRTRIKPTLKKRKRNARASARARAAWKDVGYPVIWVHRFRVVGGDAELGVMEKGMQDMVITDLVNRIGPPHCPAAISAGDDLDKVMAEIKLTESKYFDESTRMTTKNLLRPNASVTGTITQAGDQLTITAGYEHAKSGREGTVSVTGARDRIFELELQLADKLARLICGGTPKAYRGTFSGTFSSPYNDYRLRWTGEAVIELASATGYPPPGAPAGNYASYVVRSGSLHAIVSGTRGSCTLSGEGTVPIAAAGASGTSLVQTDADKPYFTIGIGPRGDETIPYTESGPDCSPRSATFSLAGIMFAATDRPLESADDTLSGSGTVDTGASVISTQFAFTPSE